ncbi:methyltransferase [Brachybacterium sp. J144]|uniref:class I SAM-dependent methyltransferase n=1 Tax=Brachybacterium sp. J144 TaxID=3116487 RepID=UPI002E7A6145|nr:methyltransferase [Brachybacterium sp. J144]MEE1651957.1 methyltransferase [Brachybacterium sp. J144]
MTSTDALPVLDQTERVILRAAEEEGGLGCPCDLLVVGDSTGALTAAALELVAEHPDARVHSWSASRAETAALAERLPEALAAGRLVLPTGTEPAPLEEFAAGAEAHLVLARLPKSLAGLEDLARRVAVLAARSGREDLTLIAGGRVKHMSRSQNDVLASVFGEVHASRGLGKSRSLVAASPRPGVEVGTAATGAVRVAVRGTERELALRGAGGVFGGARADVGSLLLLAALDSALVAGELAPERETVLDLGCGNGLLTAYLAAALPSAEVLGSDDDADAVASTRATLAASGLERAGVQVAWDESLSRVADGSTDLVLLNPPFHDGTAVDATLVQALLDAAARVLRPGGQLWVVHNSHLRYRPEVERRVGPVRERARDRRFTVLSATR